MGPKAAGSKFQILGLTSESEGWVSWDKPDSLKRQIMASNWGIQLLSKTGIIHWKECFSNELF